MKDRRCFGRGHKVTNVSEWSCCLKCRCWLVWWQRDRSRRDPKTANFFYAMLYQLVRSRKNDKGVEWLLCTMLRYSPFSSYKVSFPCTILSGTKYMYEKRKFSVYQPCCWSTFWEKEIKLERTNVRTKCLIRDWSDHVCIEKKTRQRKQGNTWWKGIKFVSSAMNRGYMSPCQVHSLWLVLDRMNMAVELITHFVNFTIYFRCNV